MNKKPIKSILILLLAFYFFFSCGEMVSIPQPREPELKIIVEQFSKFNFYQVSYRGEDEIRYLNERVLYYEGLDYLGEIGPSTWLYQGKDKHFFLVTMKNENEWIVTFARYWDIE